MYNKYNYILIYLLYLSILFFTIKVLLTTVEMSFVSILKNKFYGRSPWETPEGTLKLINPKLRCLSLQSS